MIRICPIRIEREAGDTRREAELRAVKKCLRRLNIESEIGHAASGAPYLVGEKERKISITHSADWAIVAIGSTENQSFGIDVESVSRPQLPRVIGRVLSSEEQALTAEAKNGFAKAWTAKEAVYKAVGVQNVDFAKDIRLVGKELEKAVYLPEDEMFELTFKMMDDDNLFCIATQGNKFEFLTL